MPKTTQLVLSLASKPGVLAEVGSALAQAGINITAICAGEASGGRGKVRLLVDNPARAAEALKAPGRAGGRPLADPRQPSGRPRRGGPEARPREGEREVRLRDDERQRARAGGPDRVEHGEGGGCPRRLAPNPRARGDPSGGDPPTSEERREHAGAEGRRGRLRRSPSRARPARARGSLAHTVPGAAEGSGRESPIASGKASVRPSLGDTVSLFIVPSLRPRRHRAMGRPWATSTPPGVLLSRAPRVCRRGERGGGHESRRRRAQVGADRRR
jgi:ACT domain